MIKRLLRLAARLFPEPNFEAKPTLRDEMEAKQARLRMMIGHYL